MYNIFVLRFYTADIMLKKTIVLVIMRIAHKGAQSQLSSRSSVQEARML